MTELSFLIELLLRHKLEDSTKDLLAERIREVEAGLTSVPRPRQAPVAAQPAVFSGPQQAPSTLAAMARHEGGTYLAPEPAPVSEPVAVIAQSQIAAQAMASRQQAIAESIKGTVDKTTGRPRKF